tara:strand:- start:193 stop:528 length:336 start_codon:yes stop_codon:yes gene_type:complete
MLMNKLKVIDIGHSNFSIDKAVLDLETKVSQLNFEGDFKAVKVIFGHGSGALKQTIKDWCKEQEGRFKAIIYGEDYNLFNKTAVDMRSECKLRNDRDFGRNNSGILYIWFW